MQIDPRNQHQRQHESPGDTASPEAVYRERCARAATQRDFYLARSQRMANINLGLIGLALVCIGLGIWQRSTALLGLAALLFFGFVAAYAYHAGIDRKHRRASELWALNNEGLLRLQRDWNALPLRRASSAAPVDPTATDLDIVSHASLQHLLNTTYTQVGQITLQDWLLHPAPPEVVRERQAAIAELAPLRAFREELALRALSMGDTQANYELFLEWAEGQPWLTARPWLVWLTRILPILTIAALVAQATGLVVYGWWIPLIIVNTVLALTLGSRADQIITQVAARQRIFRAYANLFELAASQMFTSPALQRINERLSAGHLPAAQHMRRLGRIMALADLRLSMLYLPLNILTLMSFHVLWLLERWQATAGTRARAWLLALGELEALTALATLRHDHPGWVFPQVAAGEPVLTARNLGHPLLPPARSVGNDVSIGPPGKLLLVTGSNMSGKSTLLRAVGANVVLAQAGGPVCAESLLLPPIKLATSIRIQDSLEYGVSYYMAELRRLKTVVEAAEGTRAMHNCTLLFLLDEILHGTNTVERQIAARQIIQYLLEQDSMGAVSTHDLTLATAPEIAAASEPVYFTETFSRGPDGPVMHFDYRLRPGIAPSTNALKLLEIVGLPLAEEYMARVESDA